MTVDLWAVGDADSRLNTLACSPMDKRWKTLRVSHSSTALLLALS